MEEERLMLVGCGVLKKEICYLINKNQWPVDTDFLNLELHNDYILLEATLRSTLRKYYGRKTVIYYGECHPNMAKILKDTNTIKIPCDNCIEILLGKELYISELSSGAYFLLDEWMHNWKHEVEKAIGKNPEIVKQIFHEDRSYLLCIRTPCSGDFKAVAEETGTTLGLPVRWVEVNLNNLESVLEHTINQGTEKDF